MWIGRLGSVRRFPVKSMAGEALERAEVGPEGLLGDRAFALRDEKAGEIRGAKRWPRLMQCSARYQTEPTREQVPAALITLPDGVSTRSDDPAVSTQLSAWLGVEVTLWPRRPASDRRHYRRVQAGASIAGVLARWPALRKLVARYAQVGPGSAELRRAFGREADEPMPDFSIFPAELFGYVSPPGTYFDAFPIHLLTTASLDALRAGHPAGDWDARRFRPNFLVETRPEVTGAVELAWAGRRVRVGEVELECTVPAPRCSMVIQAQPGLERDPKILRTIVREASAHSVGVYARVRREGQVSVGDPVELLD